MSRRGTLLRKAALSAASYFLFASGLLPGTPLQARFEPDPLITPTQSSSSYLDPRSDSCFAGAGCLLEVPHTPLPAALAAVLPRHLPAAAARSLLPESSKWLLASSGYAWPETIIPKAPGVGQRANTDSLPFNLVTRADRLHISGMFLIGIVFLLAGTGLGLMVRSPGEQAAPGAEPWIPGEKVMPRLVTSPVSPTHLKSRP